MSGVGPTSATEAVLNPGASPSPTATASAAPLQAGEQVVVEGNESLREGQLLNVLSREDD